VIHGLHRGSVWVVNFAAPWNRRPVVVITRDTAIPQLTNVTAVIVTSTVRGIRTEVVLGPEQGLDQRCVAACDNIQTLAIELLSRRIGELGPGKVRELNAAIRIALDL
jgi:mRNA interferase MazF